jgi:hypothetical protein
MKKHYVLLSAVIFTFAAQPSFALDNIIRPFYSVRSSGMGGVRLTTGLYDDNFFGNPARMAANPEFRIQVVLPVLPAVGNMEVNSGALSNISTVASGSGDTISKLGDTAGTNNHIRTDFDPFSIYFATDKDSKFSFAFDLARIDIQGDIDLRQSYEINPQFYVDETTSFAVARTFLTNNELAIGLNAHFAARGTTKSGFSLSNVVQGSSLSFNDLVQYGIKPIDFDLGGMYALPFTFIDGMVLNVGASVDDLIAYDFSALKSGNTPPPARNRSMGVGINGEYKAPIKDFFTNTVVAVEFSDIGNNPDGNLFRTLHIGGETHFVNNTFALRLGINQGYLTAGLGIDLNIVNFDLATYGEEMGLTTGDLEDRRYAFRMTIQI